MCLYLLDWPTSYLQCVFTELLKMAWFYDDLLEAEKAGTRAKRLGKLPH
jgi:hypothetical protein